MIFETHAHYDDEQFDEDREQLLAGLQEAGIETVVNVGATLEGCLSTIRLAEQYPFIYAAVGVHPDEVGTLDEEKFSWLKEKLSHLLFLRHAGNSILNPLTVFIRKIVWILF